MIGISPNNTGIGFALVKPRPLNGQKQSVQTPRFSARPADFGDSYNGKQSLALPKCARWGALALALMGSYTAGVMQGRPTTPPVTNVSVSDSPVQAAPTPPVLSNISVSSSDSSVLREVHPPIAPYATHRLKVSALHEIYIEESGNPDGYPVFYLHGGPGAGLSEEYRQIFDPKFFRIIGFEQRGCGRSTPLGELRENTTDDLIGDIEKIREKLGVRKPALIFGGSWGSLLALRYAEAHPENVAGMMIWGVSLGQPEQTAWCNRSREGAANLFPEIAALLDPILAENPISQDDIAKGLEPVEGVFNRLFNDPDVPEAKRLAAVRDYNWMTSLLKGKKLETLRENQQKPEAYREDLSSARIENHYYYNNAFGSPPNTILRNIERLRGIPFITIYNGRRDMCTPPIRAYQVHEALTKAGIPATLKIFDEVGHTAWAPPIQHDIQLALDEFMDRHQNTPQPTFLAQPERSQKINPAGLE